ncbi:MAG: HAD family hydrolase [Butyrivibrio sp.]|nr:HAD family hydrolase [Butyrivibrio sp.]
MYKNFIFDLYGTLIDIETDEESERTWDGFAAWLAERGIVCTGERARELYKSGIASLLAEPSPYSYAEIDIVPVFAVICRSGRPDVSDAEIWRAGEQFRRISTKRLGLYPNSRRVLDGLRAAGRKIYLLSNAQRVFTWQELERTGIADCFDDIFISSDEGCKKPDTAFFKRIICKHGLDVKESIMIGNDCGADIAGARAVGMDALYLRTDSSPRDGSLSYCKYVYEDGDIGHVLELTEDC